MLYRLEDYTNGAQIIIQKHTGEDLLADPATPHRYNGYRIELLLKGTLTHYIDFEQYKAKAPAIILIAPGQVHQHIPEKETEKISIAFLPDFLTAESIEMIHYLECALRSRIIPIDHTQLSALLPLAEIILREYQSDLPHKASVVKNLLNTLILVCGRMQPACQYMLQSDATQNKLAIRFKFLLKKHYKEKIRVADYAEMLHVTPGHLNDAISAVFKKNVKQLIDGMRIIESKRMLYSGSLSVKEICWQLNFEDEAYFYRFFKKHTGLTPIAFQRNTLEKYS